MDQSSTRAPLASIFEDSADENPSGNSQSCDFHRKFCLTQDEN